ncbi:MAG: UxaA family hydrolase [Firmicutes bacterium]|nr:UxaA family hydrolase [Bacillota bacterium]
MLKAYLRENGEIGIRNHLLILYTVECARVIAGKIAAATGGKLIGFSGCYANPIAYRSLVNLGRHPNVGAVIIVALGCEHTDYRRLQADIAAGSKPVELLVIQEAGGSVATLAEGTRLGTKLAAKLSEQASIEVANNRLIVGVECGGSDATSGLITNRAVGKAMDRLISEGGTVLVEEFGELLGCESILEERAVCPEVGTEVVKRVKKARRYSNIIKEFAISPGNIEGGLTTIEEKSYGALMKLGSSPIKGVIQAGDLAPRDGGLYLFDRVPNPDSRALCICGGGDALGLTDLVAAGAQLLIFTTGRGTPVGNPIAPVIKACANPETGRMLADNIDLDLSGYFKNELSLEQAAEKIFDTLIGVANGGFTRAELLGHEEYWVSYKY